MLARHFAANFVNFLIVIFVIIAGSVYWAKNQYQNEGPLESDVNFEVKKGDRFRNVSSELEKLGIIIEKVLPSPSCDSKVSSPFIRPTNSLVIDRPSPVPPYSRV